MADEPHPATGLRVRVPRQPTIPSPGTESNQDLLIQTEPQRAAGETERSIEDPRTSGPETQGSHENSILRLNRQSLKVLVISGINYESNSLTLNRDHYVSAGAVGFHFNVPTPKVTVSRRNQAQDQETGQEPVEVAPGNSDKQLTESPAPKPRATVAVGLEDMGPAPGQAPVTPPPTPTATVEAPTPVSTPVPELPRPHRSRQGRRPRPRPPW